MIYVTKINGEEILINNHLVEYAEVTPDTVLTFSNGKKMIIKESLDEFQKLVIAYEHQVLQGPIR